MTKNNDVVEHNMRELYGIFLLASPFLDSFPGGTTQCRFHYRPRRADDKDQQGLSADVRNFFNAYRRSVEIAVSVTHCPGCDRLTGKRLIERGESRIFCGRADGRCRRSFTGKHGHEAGMERIHEAFLAFQRQWELAQDQTALSEAFVISRCTLAPIFEVYADISPNTYNGFLGKEAEVLLR